MTGKVFEMKEGLTLARKMGCRAGKIRFSDARNSALLKASSGERCALHDFVLLCNFVLPVT